MTAKPGDFIDEIGGDYLCWLCRERKHDASEADTYCDGKLVCPDCLEDGNKLAVLAVRLDKRLDAALTEIKSLKEVLAAARQVSEEMHRYIVNDCRSSEELGRLIGAMQGKIILYDAEHKHE
jgi:hypothetical protein